MQAIFHSPCTQRALHRRVWGYAQPHGPHHQANFFHMTNYTFKHYTRPIWMILIIQVLLARSYKHSKNYSYKKAVIFLGICLMRLCKYYTQAQVIITIFLERNKLKTVQCAGSISLLPSPLFPILSPVPTMAPNLKNKKLDGPDRPSQRAQM